MNKKVALVGCGKAAEKHFEFFRYSPEFQLVAVCDTHAVPTNLPPTVSQYDSVHALFNRERDFDLIVVCTPPSTHRVIVCECLKYANVLVEKPIAMTSEDARVMWAAARENGRLLMEVKQNRFNAAVQDARRAIESGRLGNIRLITARLRWCRYPQYYLSNGWRGTKEHDGGVLLSQGCHILDLVRYLGGPARVNHAETWSVMDLDVEDTACATLQFESGARGILELTTAARPQNLESSISILGEHGTIVIGGDRSNEITMWALDGEPPAEETTAVTVAYRRMYDHVLRALAGAMSDVVTAESAIGSLELIESIYRAAEAPRHDNRQPIIYDGNQISTDVRFGHYVLVRGPGTVICTGTRIGSYTEIAHDVKIGQRVNVHSKCFIPELTVINDAAWIGPCVTFVNDPYPQTGGEHRKGVTVGSGAIIGANATIMAGVNIGSNAIVGAGSVVTHDVDPDSVWAGNPARRAKGRRDLNAYGEVA